MRTSLLLIGIVALSTVSPIARASSVQGGSETRPQFICGTRVQGGSFFAESGALHCNGSSVQIGAESATVMCFYQARCAPATRALRDQVSRLMRTPYERLSDDDLNRALIMGAGQGHVSEDVLVDMHVQCVGNKVGDAAPTCPGVNSCVNDRYAGGSGWRLQPYRMFNPALGAANSDGLRVEVDSAGVPRQSSESIPPVAPPQGGSR